MAVITGYDLRVVAVGRWFLRGLTVEWVASSSTEAVGALAGAA
jgi:hypothetical protein